MKLLDPALSREESNRKRFVEEAQITAQLDHPNIVGYVSHGVTEDGSPYLVMPWLDGVDLQERLRGGRLRGGRAGGPAGAGRGGGRRGSQRQRRR